jgi:hypothetical protein
MCGIDPAGRRALLASSALLQCSIDAHVGNLIATVYALGVDAEQDLDAMSRAFGNLGCGYPGVEPQGDGSVPQIVERGR